MSFIHTSARFFKEKSAGECQGGLWHHRVTPQVPRALRATAAETPKGFNALVKAAGFNPRTESDNGPERHP
jgi:hypothetical protein